MPYQHCIIPYASGQDPRPDDRVRPAGLPHPDSWGAPLVVISIRYDGMVFFEGRDHVAATPKAYELVSRAA